MKSARSVSSRRTAHWSSTGNITWWTAFGASRRAWRGIASRRVSQGAESGTGSHITASKDRARSLLGIGHCPGLGSSPGSRAAGPHDEIHVAVQDMKEGQQLIDRLAVVGLIQEAVELRRGCSQAADDLSLRKGAGPQPLLSFDGKPVQQRIPLGRETHRVEVKGTSHPRPMKGILVAMIVMNCTFASNGRLAMYATARATCSTSIVGSTATTPWAC